MSGCRPTLGICTTLFHQLTKIQGSDEANENGQKKDLTISGDIPLTPYNYRIVPSLF
jgi:hypothetical protein